RQRVLHRELRVAGDAAGEEREGVGPPPPTLPGPGRGHGRGRGSAARSVKPAAPRTSPPAVYPQFPHPGSGWEVGRTPGWSRGAEGSPPPSPEVPRFSRNVTPRRGFDSVMNEKAPATDFLRVTEIFHSVQGESTWAGLPCTFVRLTGCPLRCVWCDTAYAFKGGSMTSFDEILAEVSRHPTKLVEITGGEPLVHPGAFELADRLIEDGYTVLVET